MSEVRFYHLQSQRLETALPLILSKALDKGHRIIVKSGDVSMVQTIDKLLWSYNPDSFMPHGTDKDDHKDQQPIYITSNDDNPNAADVIFLTHGAECETLSDYALCCDLFDGNDEEAVANARVRWKKTTEKGLKATYWQQSPSGGWDKKAEA